MKKFPGHRKISRYRNQPRRTHRLLRAFRRNRSVLLPIILLGALAIGQEYKGHRNFSGSTTSAQTYTCSGKKYCSQMSSCEEATFYMNSCGVSTMDGDGDGVPCERQFCR